jgi:hypothetical protein
MCRWWEPRAASYAFAIRCTSRTAYPPYDITSHAQATVAMFDWIATQAPPWFFGVTLWKEDDYFSPTTAPAIHLMQEIPPLLREVPPLEVMGIPQQPVCAGDGHAARPRPDPRAG